MTVSLVLLHRGRAAGIGVGDMRARAGSCGDRVLARTATGPLAGDDDALDEQLAAPDAPGLPALERAGEALDACRAVPAEGLGVLDVRGRSANQSSAS